MESHALRIFAEDLVREHGALRVLDVEHSVQAYKPTLTGSISVASYYIRPPDGMTVEELIELLEKVPGFEAMNLTLVSVLGLDTYHQPLISVDDFAKKHFGSNQLRVIRVVGKSDQAIAAMAALIDGLKPGFDSTTFPHHSDFLLSGYRPSSPGRSAEVKLLFKPADANLLMRVERLVRTHLDELNMGREIRTSRHSTRGQAPDLILSSNHESESARIFLDALAHSLRESTSQEIAEATEAAQRTAGPTGTETHNVRAAFNQAVVMTLSPTEVKKRAMAAFADVLRNTGFANGLEVQIVQGGMAVEVTFPRTATSLFLSTSFDERKHVKALSSAYVAVKADPQLRDGWVAHYRFERKTGKLQVRAVDPQIPPAGDAKLVPNSN